MKDDLKVRDVISPDPEPWGSFCRSASLFEHNLEGNELLTLDALRELTHRFVKDSGPGRASFFHGNKGASAKWADWDSNKSQLESLNYCFDHISDSGQTLIILYNIERDPEYDWMMERAIEQVVSLVPFDIEGQITWPSAYVFIASPDFFTPYHIDHEVGLLLQIRGSKNMFIHDANDKNILTDQELEAYYTGNLSAANWKEDMQDRAGKYFLKPGTGVQFPPHAPHWVRSGKEYSISLSINFDLRKYDEEAKIYQVNHLMRKVGFDPSRPGKNWLSDNFKRRVVQLLANRNPQNKDEMLRSGYRRWMSLANYGRSVYRGLRPGSSR